MGVLNVTPDSFSDGGRFHDTGEAIGAGRAMFDAGAAVVDVGGESTRPGASEVSVEEELRRVIPVVRELSGRGVVSIDTRKSKVAEEAVRHGASIINDTSGVLAEIAGELQVGYVAMHCQGVPATMQQEPRYDDVVVEVWSALHSIANRAEQSGVRQIWIDPGIGFGKTVQHNVALLRSLPNACRERRSVVVGLSRKSIIGALTGRLRPADRLAGSLGAAAACWAAGVDMIRTHDVSETRDVLSVLEILSTR